MTTASDAPPKGVPAVPAGPAVSVVIPVYNERENLGPLLDEIAAALG